MNAKLSSKLLPVAAVATGAMLVFGSLPAAYADSGATAYVPPSGAVAVTMSQLNQRIAQLPQLAGVKNGDSVIIADDGSVTNAQFQGTYVYHPAGSVITMGPMYARWKDGLVAIHMSTDPANASDPFMANVQMPFATYVEQSYGTGTNYAGNSIQVITGQAQVTKPLIAEPTNARILRLPGGAWLFRDNGDGTYTALTDVFVFQSGTAPMTLEQLPTNDHSTWNADGTQQPVGVENQG